MSDPGPLQDAVNVVLNRVKDEIRFPQFVGATVIALDDSGPGIHEILLDGDSENVAAHDVTTGTALSVGDRVAVVFTPPHQLWIMGKFRDS